MESTVSLEDMNSTAETETPLLNSTAENPIKVYRWGHSVFVKLFFEYKRDECVYTVKVL